jgi:hypothetical protein
MIIASSCPLAITGENLESTMVSQEVSFAIKRYFTNALGIWDSGDERALMRTWQIESNQRLSRPR